jgi:hypothetical protein
MFARVVIRAKGPATSRPSRPRRHAYAVAMRIRLVVPGVPNGMPAMATIICPAPANPSRPLNSATRRFIDAFNSGASARCWAMY